MIETYKRIFYDLITDMTSDQLGILLNVHSLFICNDKDKTFKDDNDDYTIDHDNRNLSKLECVFYRIVNFTNDKDCALLLKLILLILDNCTFTRILSVLPSEQVLYYLDYSD